MKRKPVKAEKIRQLASEGIPLAEIPQIVGVTKGYVRLVLKPKKKGRAAKILPKISIPAPVAPKVNTFEDKRFKVAKELLRLASDLMQS